MLIFLHEYTFNDSVSIQQLMLANVLLDICPCIVKPMYLDINPLSGFMFLWDSQIYTTVGTTRRCAGIFPVSWDFTSGLRMCGKMIAFLSAIKNSASLDE